MAANNGANGAEDGKGDALMTNYKDEGTDDPHAETQNSLAITRPSEKNDSTMDTTMDT